MNKVTITISNQKTQDVYYAKSYPHRDKDGDGFAEVYKVSVYKVFIEGLDINGENIVREWKALRFMPYWNDSNQKSKYKSKGFLSAGLHSFAKQQIKNYNRAYSVSNTSSPYDGAFQIKGSFLIHAGPKNLSDVGWGAAGCIEIIGDFNLFKKDIILLANYDDLVANVDNALEDIIRKGYLFLEIINEIPPIFKPEKGVWFKQ